MREFTGEINRDSLYFGKENEEIEVKQVTE